MKKLTAFLLFLSCADFALGDYITTNVPNGCADAEFFSAMFEPNTYNCASGYYLPANTDGCRACLSGYACSGGNFAFDEITNQGIVCKNPIVENVTQGCADDLVYDGILFAQFEPNSHDCSAGYYLPANVDECTICPTNSICGGGTYSFNETTDQGIQSCASGTFAPTGSAVCYLHILHLGDDVIYVRATKLTTPSLNIDINQDGVADFFVNMTTMPVTMNKDSTHYFHIDYGDIHYYLCDDTTCPEGN